VDNGCTSHAFVESFHLQIVCRIQSRCNHAHSVSQMMNLSWTLRLTSNQQKLFSDLQLTSVSKLLHTLHGRGIFTPYGHFSKLPGIKECSLSLEPQSSRKAHNTKPAQQPVLHLANKDLVPDHSKYTKCFIFSLCCGVYTVWWQCYCYSEDSRISYFRINNSSNLFMRASVTDPHNSIPGKCWWR